jgi:DNA-binding transcriptional regulator YiaG
MTIAYDKVFLDRAADTLGRMLDYSVHSLRYDISAMIELFIASGTAGLFARGDIRTIAGMSGIELAYEVLENSGIAYERTQPRYTKSLSPEYWCGNALARMQWESGLPFEEIVRTFQPQAFITGYGRDRFSFLDSLPLDITETERAAKIRSFGEHFAEDAVSHFISETAEPVSAGASRDTPLKKMRIKNGLSQSGLAKASGVPLRTIQQYEQRQKDLAKARAEYLIALSRALGCDPSRLI